MKFHLTKKSDNKKTGPIPTSVSSRETCPDTCPFIRKGCYADAGFHTRMHWNKVTSGERGVDYPAFIDAITALPMGQLWRHNVAGDLVGVDNKINVAALKILTLANQGKRGFTYTHYPMIECNVDAVRESNDGGFTVNVSANSITHAIELRKLTGLPVVTVVESSYNTKTQVIDGERIVQCPATYRDDVTCASCQLCQRADRKAIVAFPAHGTGSKKVNLIVSGG